MKILQKCRRITLLLSLMPILINLALSGYSIFLLLNKKNSSTFNVVSYCCTLLIRSLSFTTSCYKIKQTSSSIKHKKLFYNTELALDSVLLFIHILSVSSFIVTNNKNHLSSLKTIIEINCFVIKNIIITPLSLHYRYKDNKLKLENANYKNKYHKLIYLHIAFFTCAMFIFSANTFFDKKHYLLGNIIKIFSYIVLLALSLSRHNIDKEIYDVEIINYDSQNNQLAM